MRLAIALGLVAPMLRAQGVWETRAPYPIAATEVSAAAIDGKVYAVCGVDASRSHNSLFIYDPRIDTWRQGAPVPIPNGADHCNVAAAGGKLYLLGAIRVGSSFVDGNTYEYDPAADQWRIVAQMPLPRGASGVAVIGNRIYVAGGLAGSRSVANLDAFDIVAQRWISLPNMPTARDHLTAQAVGGRIYAIAGRAGPDFNVNEEYDPASNAWRRRAPIPTARGGLGSGAIGGRIQVFGGEGNSGTPESTFRQNEEYDPVADTWRSLAPMPTPRHGLYGVTIDGRIFTPSGGPRAGLSASSVNEVFYLPPVLPPSISSDGVRNSASFDAQLAPGSLVSLFGQRLSQGEQAATRFPLPTQMNAVSVRVNGTAVPLLYVGPNQINFHLPFIAPVGPLAITVTNASAASTEVIAVSQQDSAPGVFNLGGTQGAVLVSGTGLVAGAGGRAARKGEVVEIYATGLGDVTLRPAPGEAAPLTQLVRTTQTPVVVIGGVNADVLFSGLAPGLVGLYQVNARVPERAPLGPRVPLVLLMLEYERTSNTVTIAVE